MKSRRTCEHSAVLLALAILFGLLGPLPAQSPTGTISGSVTDSSGAVVGKATVRITNVQTQETHTAATNDAGDYLFPSVPTGEYVLGAQASGFKQEQRAGIVLDVNQNARVDFALQVGQVNEVVEVKGGATQVDTRSVQLGGTVDTRRVQDLPLDGRNVYDFMALMPGSKGRIIESAICLAFRLFLTKVARGESGSPQRVLTKFSQNSAGRCS